VDTAAHRPQLDPERRGDLLVRQSFDVAQHDRRAVFGRQGLQCLLHVGVEMARVECLGGCGLAVAQQAHGLIAEPFEPDPLPAPGHVEEEVGGDPVQPALEGARGVAGERAEDPHEDLLGEVLGVVHVAGEPVREPVDPRRVLAHQVIPARRRPLRRRLGLTRWHSHGLGRSGFAHRVLLCTVGYATTIMSPRQNERISRPHWFPSHRP
jgi:hypothetical protein